MASKQDTDWRVLVEGLDDRYRRGRSIFRRIPHAPRCKMCAAPFGGAGAPLMRVLGRGQWPKNPNFCGKCMRYVETHHGGAEVELTCLFADVRGSTTLAERMAPHDFSDLLNRFYELAARVVIEHDGIVDKFVGDEIVALFCRAFAGDGHAAAGVSAACGILAATGQGSADGAWIPIGAGVHTGIAYLGSVGGEGGVTDFTALGDAVNTTARLASSAGAGEILVSRATAEASGLPAAGYETRHLELRGRTEPVDVVVLHSGRVAVPA